MASGIKKLSSAVKSKLTFSSANAVSAIFDEAGYLALYPDVAAAVQSGNIASGQQHYQMHGYLEGRIVPGMARPEPLLYPFPRGTNATRRDKILANLHVANLQGLEIGALASPTVTANEGQIFYVDHVDTETLIKKYGNDPSVDRSGIVQVNAVCGAQSLQECIGKTKKVDYVVAPHVIEHVPDLITWLAEIYSILRAKGSLRLAIPDRRYTFDILKYESRLQDVVDAYLRRTRAPLPRQVLEHFGWATTVDCEAAWKGTLNLEALKPIHSWKDAIALAQDALANHTYHDAHCWIFTPLSFAKLCSQMVELDLLMFACDYCIETPRNQLEFYAALSPCDDKQKAVESWTRIVNQLNVSKTYQHETPSLQRERE